MTRWDFEARGGWDTFVAHRELYLGTPWRGENPVAVALPRLLDGWNLHDPELVAAAYTPDGVRDQRGTPVARHVGRTEIAAAVGAMVDALPDCMLTVGRTSPADGAVTLEWTLAGTHLAALAALPASGARLEIRGVSVCRMEGDLIAEERVYWDGVPMLEAAGLLEPA